MSRFVPSPSPACGTPRVACCTTRRSSAAGSSGGTGRRTGRSGPSCIWRGASSRHATCRSKSFRLGIEGEELVGGWKWVEAREQADESGLRDDDGNSRQAVVQLSHTQRPLEVRVCTRLDGGDWLVRWLEITNRGKKTTAISSACPMSGRLWAHRYDEHMPADAPSPFELAYNHSSSWGFEGDMWPEPLRPGRFVFDGQRNGKSGWSRPAFWAQDLANGQAFVCELAWSGNWQFELDCRMDYASKQAQLYFAIGLAPAPGEMLRVLGPGATVRTPSVHIGCFEHDTDRIVQSLHRHVRHTVMPKPPAGAEIEANHRGYTLRPRERARPQARR